MSVYRLWLDVLRRGLAEGCALEDVDLLVGGAPLSEDERDALWLYGYSALGRRCLPAGP